MTQSCKGSTYLPGKVAKGRADLRPAGLEVLQAQQLKWSIEVSVKLLRLCLCTSHKEKLPNPDNKRPCHWTSLNLVATIHLSPFTHEKFTDFLFIHGFFSQQEGSFCPFTYSLGNHGRILHLFTPFTQIHALHSCE